MKNDIQLRKSRLSVSMENRKARQGFAFLIPWLIGFTVFFLLPTLQSIWYSFSKSSPIDDIENGFFSYVADKFAGIEFYRNIWLEDTNFTSNLFDSITNFLYSLPIILFLSFVFALVLNQDFRGRMTVRAIFFLPVIIASGVVLSYLNGDANAQELLGSESSGSMYNSLSFSEMLQNLGLPSSITNQLNAYISSIFNLVWGTGVQTILFLAGLQSISAQYYEVAQVEGATKWEVFWYVTFPMTANILILNTVYTCIDLFTSNSNQVMQQAYELIENSNYNKSSAIMWCYFVILGLIIGLILILFRKPMKNVEL